MSWLSLNILLLLFVPNIFAVNDLGFIINSTFPGLSNFTEFTDLGSWVPNSESHNIGIRSQRDSMNLITVDQLPQVGVILRDVLFHNEFIENNKTEVINYAFIPQYEYLLDMLIWGIQTFVIDIEVSPKYTWVVKDTGYLFSDVMALFNDFVASTDTNLLANVVTILLRVDPVMKVITPSNTTSPTNITNTTGSNSATTTTTIRINFDDNTFSKYPNLNISAILDTNITRSFKYTPTDLIEDRARGGYVLQSDNASAITGWPSLSNFLYYKKKRMIVAEITDIFDNISPSYVFNNSVLHYDTKNGTIACPNTVEAYKNTSSISFRYLESEFNEDDIASQVSCGYSPIISNTFTTSNISMLQNLTEPAIIWSWGPGEPILTNSTRHKKLMDLTADNCAAFEYSLFYSKAGWVVENCYEHKRALCRSNYNGFTWVVTSNKDAYFEMEGYKGETKCPNGYSFSKPMTPLEQSAALMFLKSEDVIDGSLWIDLNSISVANCWVSDGAYAQCPYQRVFGTRNFVTMMVPISVCAFILLCLATYLSLLRMPINDNRHKWEKIVSNYAKTEMEGVPS
ncbi:Maintenance of telomere capping protein 6 [Nakaseomyces bracarensis]|uniref:Maintenance of telomere capping protein 6 n=1 Tax=Nakaseomyces bracarensis TaxID=273131 RepID=A0ABR4NNX0_9SACH